MRKERSEINYQIKRIGNSPYFKSDFHQLEKNFLENNTGLKLMAPSENNYSFENLPEIVITNTHNKLDHHQLIHFAKTKLIVHANSGYDNFTLDFVRNFPGEIILGNEIRSNAVASYILSAFFKHFSSIPEHSSWDKNRLFHREDTKKLKGIIIGLGVIGTKVVDALKNLDIDIDIYDPFKKGFESSPLEYSNSRQYDFLILTCSFNPTNKHIINKSFLKHMASEALIINTARGELINTNELLTFLDSNPKAFAYLDVFEEEPCDFNQFNSFKNLHCTSHIAGVFNGIDQATFYFESKVINDYLNYDIEKFKKIYQSLILKNRIHQNYLI